MNETASNKRAKLALDLRRQGKTYSEIARLVGPVSITRARYLVEKAEAKENRKKALEMVKHENLNRA